jgi:HAD superfamily hydrolase (TIGR01509 family)
MSVAEIKAVVFDMDGVLIDAKDWHYEALNRALDIFGVTIDRQAHLSTFDGLPTRKKLQILSSTQGLPEGLHGLLNDLKQTYTMEISYAKCRPVFALQQALSRLRADGYRLAVCSNSIRQTVATMMQLSALAPYLELQLSNEDVRQAKPDPEIYTLAMGRLGLRPEECLIVEDNDHGVQAARASGGHLMVVGGVGEVTYDRIKAMIAKAEGRAA